MSPIRSALDNGDLKAALDACIQAKRLRRPVPDLDLLRARCFLAMGKLGDAREALREELRHYPENGPAQRLLAEVTAEEKTEYHGDDEFFTLLRRVRPHTMLPENRLHNLYRCIRNVLLDDSPGNFAEFGVAGGGSTALMALLIQKHSKRPRTVFAFDTFNGMPDPTREDRLHDGIDADATGWGAGSCAAPCGSVRHVCHALGISEVVRIVPGLFKDTLPEMRSRMGTLAFLHCDADWYVSTRDIFTHAYPLLTEGGIVVVDDYGYWDGCTRAVDQYLERMNRKPELKTVQGGGAVWFIKEAP